MEFAAVLFDCDGVLVDSEAIGLHESAAALRPFGVEWTAADLITRYTGLRQDHFLAALRADVSAVQGGAIPDAQFSALVEAMLTARRSQRHLMDIVAGARDSVAAAAARGPVAVASSSALTFLTDKIERFGFARWFGPHVYSADAVANGKPAPDIFLHAADGIDVAPARCLVIEDSTAGVVAGTSAGMLVWGFTGGGHCVADHGDRLRAAGAERVFADHASLAAALGAERS